MTDFDTQYQRWNGRHTGIWRRRWAITENGLRLTLRGKFARWTVTSGWYISFGLVMAMFFLGQFLVSDSALFEWIERAGDEVQIMARGITTWLELNPDVSVAASHNLLFYYFSNVLSLFSLIAALFIMPNLITLDLASSAITIYTSKAVSRLDYLLGKFFSVFGIMAMAWYGPLLLAWVLGNFVSPRWHFFKYSSGALWNLTVVFFIVATAVSLIALALSSMQKNSKTVSGNLIGLVIFGNIFRQMSLSGALPEWFQFSSLMHNIIQVNNWSFDAVGSVEKIRSRIPMADVVFDDLKNVNEPQIAGSLMGLLVMAGISLWILTLRTRTE